MSGKDTITCLSCFREWDGNAQCPCWMDEDEGDTYPVSQEELLPWHHLSREQVLKGIISQFYNGNLPREIKIMIFKKLKQSIKMDEDITRDYYEKGIYDITKVSTIRPIGRGIEWSIKLAPNLAIRGPNFCKDLPDPRKIHLISITHGDRWVRALTARPGQAHLLH